MKRIIVGTLALLLIAGAAQAQVKGQMRNARAQHGKIFQELNLTDAQKSQLKELRQKEKLEMQAVKKNEDNMLVKDWKSRRKELREKYRTQFQSILTEEQKDKLAKLRGRGRSRAFADRFHRRGNLALEHKQEIAKQLNLTPEQRTNLKDMRQSFRTKAQELRNDKSLTREQKKNEFKDLIKQQKEQLKTVLTQEQLQKIESRMKDFKDRRRDSK